MVNPKRSASGFVFALALCILVLPIPLSHALATPHFNKIVLISLDGANPDWIAELIRLGQLPNLASLMRRGAMNYLFIVDHDCSTDPGLSTIETGYGPALHKIYANVFGATMKISIPVGLTIGERIKSHYGSTWKVAIAIPWATAPMPKNVTTNVDPIFWNLKKATDYWLAAENLTWKPSDPEFNDYAFTPTGLINASYLARRVLDEFIRPNSAGNFYVRIHMTEPDAVGHGTGVEKTVDPLSQYAWSLQQCDRALGVLTSGLEGLRILDDTLVLVTTDHGFIGGGHDVDPKPSNGEDVWKCFLVMSHSNVGSPTGVGVQDDIAATVLSAAGISLEGLNPSFDSTSRAMPLFLATEQSRETKPPEVVSVSFPDQVTEGTRLNGTVTLSDPSGVSLVEVYYQVGSNLYSAKVTRRQGSAWIYDVQTVRIWNANATRIYLEFYDDSVLKNKGHYPSSGTITVAVKPAQQEQPAPSTDYTIYVYGAIATVLMTALAYWYLSRRPK